MSHLTLRSIIPLLALTTIPFVACDDSTPSGDQPDSGGVSSSSGGQPDATTGRDDGGIGREAGNDASNDGGATLQVPTDATVTLDVAYRNAPPVANACNGHLAKFVYVRTTLAFTATTCTDVSDAGVETDGAGYVQRVTTSTLSAAQAAALDAVLATVEVDPPESALLDTPKRTLTIVAGGVTDVFCAAEGLVPPSESCRRALKLPNVDATMQQLEAALVDAGP